MRNSITSVMLLLMLLFMVTSTSSQAQVCFTSDAAAAAYDDGWQEGDNDGTGFGPWVQFTNSADPNENGFFVFTSTENGDGIDDNGDGDIDTGGRAWGIYANSGAQAFVSRTINTPLGDGSSLSFGYDNGPVVGVQNNFTLVNAAGAVLMYAGVASGYPEYAVFDALGGRFTGAPNAAAGGEGIRVDIEIISSGGDYEMTITTLADGATYTVPGQFFAQPDFDVAQVDFNNNNNGPGATHNLYVNSLEACYPDTDDDGVADYADLCPGTTIPETVPTVDLGTNRFALVDGDFVFDTKAPKGRGPNRSYTTTDTGGCSCEQIITEQNLGQGHTKHGCSISAMDDWVAVVGGASKRSEGADAVEAASVPEAYVLEAAYPNPFNPQTTIRFGLREASYVRLVVYDMLGRQVEVLADGIRDAGTHEVSFEAGALSSGTYLYRLTTPSGSITRSMVLMK